MPKRRNTRKRAVERYVGHIKRKYDLSLEDYVKLLLLQKKCCAICKRSREEIEQDFHVDHDHDTGEVRGLLCKRCNRILGVILDSTSWLDSALIYLKTPPARLLKDLRE